VSGYEEIARNLEACGWQVIEIQLQFDGTADCITAHAELLKDDVPHILELLLHPYGEVWLHTVRWFDERHKARHATQVGEALRPEQAIQILSGTQEAR
jgi:hypothetical protein